MDPSIPPGIFNDSKKSNDPALALFQSPVEDCFNACASAPTASASESKDCDLPSECELEAARAVLARGSGSAAAKIPSCILLLGA